MAMKNIDLDGPAELKNRNRDTDLVRASYVLCGPSLAAIWNNPEDDAYDAMEFGDSD
jgi:hypothetical protein